jgi:kinesin family protein C2/C3
VEVHNLWEKSRFSFDAVFFPAETEAVFKDCCDLVQSAMDGHNVAMFAYGQTGAGKTHTLFGRAGQPGVTARAIHELFRIIGNDRERFMHTVTLSMLELHRNDLVDLFRKESVKHGAAQKLSIRVDQSGQVQIDNLTERVCSSAEELIGIVECCLRHRTTRATAMNAQSSRSHLICSMKISRVNLETGNELRGKLMICDLAGSERLKKSNVVGDAAKEAIEINRSLTALGDVMSALRQSQKHAPYRNHKLTQLMQDCLGRHSKVLMFVNCSPSNSNIEETLMSLKYASRAKKIRTESSKKSPKSNA